MFLGKTLNPHRISVHPGVQMSTFKFNAGDNPGMNGSCVLICRSTYMYRRTLDQDISVDMTVDMSTDVSVNMSVDI